MRQKTKDNLIYLGTGLAIAAGFIAHMFYTERSTGTIQTIPLPTLWGIFSTPGIVALIFQRFWEHRRRRSLWVIAVVVASINVLAVFVASSLRWNPRLIVWSTLTVVWIFVVFLVAQRFLTRN